MILFWLGLVLGGWVGWGLSGLLVLFERAVPAGLWKSESKFLSFFNEKALKCANMAGNGLLEKYGSTKQGVYRDKR